MMKHDDGRVLVTVQIEIPMQTTPPNGTIIIEPKMNKSEYENMRNRLLGWVKYPESVSYLSNVLLDPSQPPKNLINWKIDPTTINITFVSRMKQGGLKRLDDELNNEQVKVGFV